MVRNLPRTQRNFIEARSGNGASCRVGIAVGGVMDFAKIMLGSVLAFIPDIFVGWAYAKLVDGGWTEFWYAVIALQALYFVLWVKRALWAWLLFWVYQKRAMARHMEKVFRDSKFPRPEMWVGGLDDYTDQILMDDTAEAALKTKAAFEKGTLAGFRAGQRLSLLFMTESASRLAITRYARYAPERTLEDAGFE